MQSMCARVLSIVFSVIMVAWALVYRLLYRVQEVALVKLMNCQTAMGGEIV